MPISLPLIHFKLQLVLQFIFSQPSGSDSGLGDHPLPHTQAFLKNFVIRLASCMQINQPTMKVTEQSTKITLKPSANSHFQGREIPELSHGGARTPRSPVPVPQACTSQYMQNSEHREALLTWERLDQAPERYVWEVQNIQNCNATINSNSQPYGPLTPNLLQIKGRTLNKIGEVCAFSTSRNKLLPVPIMLFLLLLTMY